MSVTTRRIIYMGPNFTENQNQGSDEIFISDEQIILIDKVIDSKYFKNVIFYSKIALPSF